ncbi:hypothetical protein [Wukongibacter sp. M2B1]|uniref:hypothetical protein n=1 Tax=Wukongibacter sp. M2B1 TaxID=3088895 RepID=UPI003D7B9E29
MKVEFSKDGLIINSKKFDPLNFNVGGYEIQSNVAPYKKDPFEMLEALVSIKNCDDSKLDRIKVLKSMTEK